MVQAKKQQQSHKSLVESMYIALKKALETIIWGIQYTKIAI